VTDVPARRRNAAMVFQGYALWPHMTVAQNVAFGLDVRKVPGREKKKRVAEALSLVRMNEYAHRKPGQLSGGQQQRVALARAVVVRPDVLLLDEPLSNLDAKLRVEMRDEIRRICKESQTTTVYVTHDQEEAMSMADRICVLKDGRTQQVGTPDELYRRPASRFVADFLGHANFIRGTIAEAGLETIVETPVGRLHSRVAAAEPHEGTHVVCSVRPEALRILADGETADNVVTGRHLGSTYLGTVVQHRFDLADGLIVRVNEIKTTRKPWTNGAVRMGASADDIVVLAE